MSRNTNILLTGGTGYIGSHTALALTSRGYNVVLLDNLANSSAEVVDAVRTISGRDCTFIEGDIRDGSLLKDVLRKHQIGSVIHFAGLKSVSDSIEDPISYYSTNVVGTLELLAAMASEGISKLVFSSSATVYGVPAYLPIDEAHPTSPVNPYGRSKLHCEEILRDVAAAGDWSIVCLRYFNPAGAHESALLGERPTSRPNNLLPVISEVALGQSATLQVYGNDYDTPDGTGVRDFIHVMDLAEGHEAALRFAETSRGFETFNLGTGQGYSVLEMVQAYEQESGRSIARAFSPRRPGDVASCYADTSKASQVLNWQAARSLHQMCASSWANVSAEAGAHVEVSDSPLSKIVDQ
ncbi:UDP-glucose 4-epimerase GalE [Pseudorhizobium marinum]|uniref:UDP-glucose 4-epimerase GalE n=1 Tax=Pseudorhizobium marinum TaxID=1496690 RepID=UPI00097C18DD|nr:UDP-glucose 4-epimerase GalE [Pseudorhizobium marinum]